MPQLRKSMPRGRTPRDPAREAAALPAAERRRRIREFWIALILIAAVAGLLLLQPITGYTRGVGDSSLFLFLNAVTVILILVFGFLVTRNFWKLVGERNRGILGSRLHLKFVAAFVLIALVTTSGLFIVSAFFITQSIDKWFSVPPRTRSSTRPASPSGSRPRDCCERTARATWRPSSRPVSETAISASSRCSARRARSW
jgi:hypothetical protein